MITAKYSYNLAALDAFITLAAFFMLGMSNKWRVPGGLTSVWTYTGLLTLCGLALDLLLLIRAHSRLLKVIAILGLLVQVYILGQLGGIASEYRNWGR
jgi:hypothetical protein